MADCIFCKVIEGGISAKKVFESKQLLAFEDINPVAPVHVLIIPKKHISTLNDVEESDAVLLGEMIMCAKKIAGDYLLSKDGYRMVINCMAGAGQSVFHVHLHLLGGRPFRWPPG